MVEEEVHHLAGVGEHREEAEQRRGPGAAAEGVEAGEEAAGAEGLAAEPGGHLPALGPSGEIRVGGLGVPVRQLGDVLEGLDELVDPVSLREEDDQLVDGVAHGVDGREGWRAGRRPNMSGGAGLVSATGAGVRIRVLRVDGHDAMLVCSPHYRDRIVLSSLQLVGGCDEHEVKPRH